MKITTHFELADVVRSSIAIAHGIVQVPTPEQVERATWLAVHILEPIIVSIGGHRIPYISSWLRTLQVNQIARGSKTSAHLYGRAVDWEAPPWSNLQFAQHIRKLNLKELDKLILEFPDKDDPKAGWVHLQCAEKGNVARGQVFTAKRINGKTIYIEGLTI